MPADRRGIRVALLGPVLVETRSGALVEPAGILAKALLITLAEPNGSGAGRTHGVEAIADAIWGDEPPRNAKAALQTLVSRLRTTAADGLIASRAGGYALAVAPTETDAGLAHELGRDAARLAHAGDPVAAVAKLDHALALWRGGPGVDLGESPVGRELADASAALRLGLRELRARYLLDAGDPAGAVEALGPLVTGHPLDEQLQYTWLRALAASGRRADALAGFAALRTALRDELGISPGPQLVALNAELLREQEVGAAPARHAAVPSRAAQRDARVRVGVRAAPNALLGRAADVAAVESLLGEHRLVTVLGPGGLGKTRLAQEVAARSAAPAVVVVELASVRSDEDVVLALASTLGVREASARASARLTEGQRPDVRARLVDLLSERRTLLVLDNCEHVIEGAAAWTSDLLAAVPGLTVLATSRSPVAIGAEQVLPLEPLPAIADGGAGPAVELFLERARAVRPGAALPLETIARLCDRLDGLPLAIELAAARVRSLTVEQIEARLTNRFALLTTGDRAAPERQRTLRAVIEWSWALLSEGERDALPRLAWFVDGFGLDAAEAVLARADALDVLERLIDQSLLMIGEDALGRPRYRMLETVREFGQSEQSDGERDDALTAIDRWATAFARAELVEARSPHQLTAFAELTVEQDNLVAVVRRAIGRRDAATVFGVFGTLAYYWTVRSRHSEILSFTDPVLDATRGFDPGPELAEPATLSFAIMAGTNLAVLTTTGLRALARLRLLARRRLPLPRWLDALSDFLLATPDFALAARRLDAMVGSGDDETAMLGNVMRAQFEENDGEPESAERYARRAHELATKLGDMWVAALAGLLLAQLASQSGRAEEALDWALEAQTALELLEAEEDLLQLEWMIAVGLIAAGRHDEARRRLLVLLDDDRVTLDGMELAQVAELGLAELARIEGDQAGAFAHAQRVVDGFRDPRTRSSPWFLMTLAGLVAGGARDAWPDETLAEWADVLRRRAAAMLRARPGYTDRPVLGTVAAGWSAWGIRRPEHVDRALELFALAEVLRARQDLPALRLDVMAADVADAVGVRRLEEARRRAAALSADEQTERARAIVAEPVPSA